MSSPTTRYLVFFQYFGTKYSGVMETLADQSVLGVQNYLERAAQNLRPVTPIKFYVSSRTDTGVHALCNSAHLDVQRGVGKPPFPERVIVSALNYHLKPEPIRGLQFWELEFKSRSFLYRQVRRMAGALVAVGQGRLAPYHIKELLEIRDSLAYPQNTMAPAAGLFLKSVEYDDADVDTEGNAAK